MRIVPYNTDNAPRVQRARGGTRRGWEPASSLLQASLPFGGLTREWHERLGNTDALSPTVVEVQMEAEVIKPPPQ